MSGRRYIGSRTHSGDRQRTPPASAAIASSSPRILSEEDLAIEAPRFAGADVISLIKGRVWPEWARARYPLLTSVSIILAAQREA